MATTEYDVAILMPKITDMERFTVRYTGLSQALSALSMDSFFAESHVSYDDQLHGFHSTFDVNYGNLATSATATVVRDLTMALDAKPLYEDEQAPKIVHHPDTNRFIANKVNLATEAPQIHPHTIVVSADTVSEAVDGIPGDKVLLKPTTGMVSKGIYVLSKQEAATAKYGPGQYLLQEFIDTSGGIPSLGIEGMHNLRVISVGSVAVGAIARVGSKDKDILKDDVYGSFTDVDNLPEAMHTIVDTVHEVLHRQPGSGENIIAIDIMRGRNGSGELVDVLCEVNRRPMRVSRYSLRDNGNLDNGAILRLAKLWDRAEAELLARQVG
jgi:glutathione synthase/RimK-type ligase-like ATP-grasp enzyme